MEADDQTTALDSNSPSIMNGSASMLGEDAGGKISKSDHLEDDEDNQQSKESLCVRCGFEKRLFPYMNFFFWVYARGGCVWPYYNLYFKQLGLRPQQIGFISGIRPFAGFLCAPLWGLLADKFNLGRKILYFSIITFAVFLGLIANVPVSPWTEENCEAKHLSCSYQNISQSNSSSAANRTSCYLVTLDAKAKEDLLDERDWMFESNGLHRIFVTLIILCMIMQFIEMPIFQLGDAEILNILGKDEIHKYGFARRPGSIALGLFSFSVGGVLNRLRHNKVLCGLDVPITDYRASFYTGIACQFFNALSVMCFKTKPKVTSPKKGGEGRTVRLRLAFSVFKSVHYGSWLVCMVIMGMCNGVIWSFLFWHLENIGATQMLIGTASAINNISEFIVFSLAFVIRDLIGTFNFMAIGILGYVIRFSVFALIENPWLILPMEVLQGFSTGIWCILVAHLCSAVPPENVTTMLGILSGMYWGLGSGTGDVIGGQLVGAFGARNTFWIMAVVSVVNLIIFTIAQKTSKMPEPFKSSEHTDGIPLLPTESHDGIPLLP